MGLEWPLNSMTLVLISHRERPHEEHVTTEARWGSCSQKPGEVKGCQRNQKLEGGWQIPLRDPGRAQPCPHLDFRPRPLDHMQINVSCFKPHSCGPVLGQS